MSPRVLASLLLAPALALAAPEQPYADIYCGTLQGVGSVVLHQPGMPPLRVDVECGVRA